MHNRSFIAVTAGPTESSAAVDSEGETITKTLQDVCSRIESLLDEEQPISTGLLSDFALWFLRMLNAGCSVPPALRRLYVGSDSYLSRENLLDKDPVTVCRSMLSFASLLNDVMENERKKEAEAEEELPELGRQEKLFEILKLLEEHDDPSSALKQDDIRKEIKINTRPQMSKYLKDRRKYGLWTSFSDGTARRYRITEKGRRVLNAMKKKDEESLQTAGSTAAGMGGFLQDPVLVTVKGPNGQIKISTQPVLTADSENSKLNLRNIVTIKGPKLKSGNGIRPSFEIVGRVRTVADLSDTFRSCSGMSSAEVARWLKNRRRTGLEFSGKDYNELYVQNTPGLERILY